MECSPIGFVRRRETLREVSGRREVFEWDELLRKEESTIELLDEFCEGLEGIRKGSFLWVIWYAHLTKERPVKVRPYKDPNMPLLGVFVTRSPARPCPLGLSLVYVTAVEGCKLRVKGLDAVNGTPVLDIKHYYEGLDSPEALLRLAEG